VLFRQRMGRCGPMIHRWVEAAASARYFCGTAGFGQVGFGEYDQSWPLSKLSVLGAHGAKVPLIGKLDIGESAEGFVRVMQEALGRAGATKRFSRRCSSRLAMSSTCSIYRWVRISPAARAAFLQNFLALITLPPDQRTPLKAWAR